MTGERSKESEREEGWRSLEGRDERFNSFHAYLTLFCYFLFISRPHFILPPFISYSYFPLCLNSFPAGFRGPKPP
jgi:hypothetical protein